MTILTVPSRHPLRREAQDLITAVYAETYGAAVDDFPPELIVALDAAGVVIAAAGLRFDRFFSECYLDAPAEAELSRVSGAPVRREAVFEVTTLACRRPSAALALIEGIVAHGRALGMRWAFFTLTERLRAALRRWGVPVLDLCAATPERVRHPERWGRYYLTEPRVCAIADEMVRLGAPPRPEAAVHA